jgi:hypothetical protein
MTNTITGILFILLALNGLMVWWMIWKIEKEIEEKVWTGIDWIEESTYMLFEENNKLQSQIKQLKSGGKK